MQGYQIYGKAQIVNLLIRRRYHHASLNALFLFWLKLRSSYKITLYLHAILAHWKARKRFSVPITRRCPNSLNVSNCVASHHAQWLHPNTPRSPSDLISDPLYDVIFNGFPYRSFSSPAQPVRCRYFYYFLKVTFALSASFIGCSLCLLIILLINLFWQYKMRVLAKTV